MCEKIIGTWKYHAGIFLNYLYFDLIWRQKKVATENDALK